MNKLSLLNHTGVASNTQWQSTDSKRIIFLTKKTCSFHFTEFMHGKILNMDRSTLSIYHKIFPLWKKSSKITLTGCLLCTCLLSWSLSVASVISSMQQITQ